MRFTWKEAASTKTNSNSSEGWGMGFLLVFFPPQEDHLHHHQSSSPSSPSDSDHHHHNTSKTTAINAAVLSRSRSTTNILYKAQSTLSICAFLIFLSLLLFTLSSFEPPTSSPISRRHLSSSSPTIPPPLKPQSWSFNFRHPNFNPKSKPHPFALQGMGTLFRRGTKAMNNLIVAHITQSTTPPEFRLFLRLFHLSPSKSDLLFIFPPTHSPLFHSIIHQENQSHSKFTLHQHQHQHQHQHKQINFTSSKKEKDNSEPIWGKRLRTNSTQQEAEIDPTRFSYGSILGFEADELDPENTLAGFIDGGRVPMSLRRWACYPMLLGRIRHNFKHVMLVNVKEILILGDPFVSVVNKAPESVYLSRKNFAKLQKPVDPAAIVGGARGIRRISSAMLTEIVRVSMQRKKKSSLAELSLLNKVVGNEFVVKNIKLITSTEPIIDAVSLAVIHGGGSSSLFDLSSHKVARRGNSNLDVTSIILKHLCSLEVHSSFYSDC